MLLIRKNGKSKVLTLTKRQILNALGGRIDIIQTCDVANGQYFVLHNKASKDPLNTAAHLKTGFSFNILRGNIVLCPPEEMFIIKNNTKNG